MVSQDIEFIQYDVETFIALRSVDAKAEHIQTINELFQKYANCFTESLKTGDANDQETRNSKSTFKSGGSHMYRRPPGSQHMRLAPVRRNKQLGYEDKLKREVQSLLNKVSSQNINTITSKLVCLLDVNNCKCVMEVVLAKSSMQDSYIDYYCHIIVNLHTAMVKDVREFTALFDAYYQSFCESLQALTVDSDILRQDNYDTFCDYIKVKKHLYGKNKILLLLAKQGIASYSQSDLFNVSFKFLTNKCKNDAMYEIALNIIFEHVRHFPNNQDQQKLFKEYYNTTLINCLTFKKVIFMVEDFLKTLSL